MAIGRVDHRPRVTGVVLAADIPKGRGVVRDQHRGRKITIGPAEVDAFRADEQACRVATGNAQGSRRARPWFAREDHAWWPSLPVSSQAWTDREREPGVAALVGPGNAFSTLRSVETRGRLDAGEVSRAGAPDPILEAAERLPARTYAGRGEKHPDGRHRSLRLTFQGDHELRLQEDLQRRIWPEAGTKVTVGVLFPTRAPAASGAVQLDRNGFQPDSRPDLIKHHHPAST